MTTITLDEATRNQVLAALDERAARLEHEIAVYQGRTPEPEPPASEDGQRALVWNIAALHETNMARLAIGEAEQAGTPWTEAELRVAAGNR